MRTTDHGSPLDRADTLLTDLDGVVYRGAAPVPHAVESLRRARATHRVGFLTNNASRTDVAIAAQLAGFGLNVEPCEVITSAQAAVDLLGRHVRRGERVLAVGGPGVTSELEKAGFPVVRKADDGAAAVVQGLSAEVTWSDLAQAAYALQRDPARPWIATNLDPTVPQAGGIAPGNGAFVAAVQAAVGRVPLVVGKPEAPIFETAVARLGGRRTLFVGDRLDTDVAGARHAGLAAALVLTGIDREEQVLAAGPERRPDYLLADLRDLFEPYPELVIERGPDFLRASSGGAVAVTVGDTLRLERPGTPIDALRAVAAAVWSGAERLDVHRVAAELRDATGHGRK